MKLLIVSPSPEHPPRDAFRLFRALSEELSRRGHTIDYYIEPHGESDSKTEQAGIPPITPDAWQTVRRGMGLLTRISGACRERQYNFILTAGTLGWALAAMRRFILPSQTRLLAWHGGHTTLQSHRANWPDGAAASPFATPGTEVSGDHPEDSHHAPKPSDHAKPQTARTLWLPRQSVHQWLCQQVLTTHDAHFFNTTEAPLRVLAEHPHVQPKQLLYLPSGVAKVFYHPQRHPRPENESNDSSYQKQAPRLLMLGPWASDPQQLADALQRVQQTHPLLKLTIAQAGSQGEALRAILPAPCQDTLTVLPSVSEAARIALFQQHDVYLQPAALEGGVPLSLLEAMAGSLPVIAEEAPGLRDVIRHYENGLLIPARDANALEQSLTHVLERPDLARALGEAAYDHVSHYATWRQIADIFEDRLFQMLQNRLVGSQSWSEFPDA